MAALLAPLALDRPTRFDPTVPSPLLSAERQWRLVAATVRVGVGRAAGPVASAVCVGHRDGSAFLLTALHAVPTGEGRTYEFFTKESHPAAARMAFNGEVLERFGGCDLALVKIRVPADAAPVLPLAGRGQRPKRFPFDALAVGCPGGVAPRVRAEEVQAKRLVRRAGGLQAFFWETGTTLEGGMSGGPLVGAAGELLGICTATAGGQGYYVHLDEVQAALKKAGHGWLIPPPRPTSD